MSYRHLAVLTIVVPVLPLSGATADGTVHATDSQSARLSVGAQKAHGVEHRLSESGPGDNPDPVSPRKDLSGRWVMVQDLHEICRIPLFGSLDCGCKSVWLFKVRQKNDELDARGMICGFKLRTGTKLLSTRINGRVLGQMPRRKIKFELVEKDGKRFLKQRRTSLDLGARLRGMRDSLPKSTDDPRLIDQDLDGKPGVSILISGLVSGEIYFAQRMITSFEIPEKHEGYFHGGIWFDSKKVVYGGRPSIIASPPNMSSNPKDSRVSFYQVPQDFTCAAARSRHLKKK